MGRAILAASLGTNALLGFFFLVSGPENAAGEKMTCDQSRSETGSKQATAAYAALHDASFEATHQFLRASGFALRNLHSESDGTTFVYIARSYGRTCGRMHWPGFDGSIVRVKTDIRTAPRITDVW